MVTQDHDLGRQATLEMGLESSHYDAMSLMLTFRPASSATGLGGRMSKQDVDGLKARYSGIKPVDINRFMQRLPRVSREVGGGGGRLVQTRAHAVHPPSPPPPSSLRRQDLLFVLRSINMVRSLNLELGGTARERFRITGEWKGGERACSHALAS